MDYSITIRLSRGKRSLSPDDLARLVHDALEVEGNRPVSVQAAKGIVVTPRHARAITEHLTGAPTDEQEQLSLAVLARLANLADRADS